MASGDTQWAGIYMMGVQLNRWRLIVVVKLLFLASIFLYCGQREVRTYKPLDGMVKKLEQYKKKRNFKSTPEPKPVVKCSAKDNLFVIQQHHASHMHYDLRLEVNGVLKSWAVPKGPSLNPKDKRLAAETEDHPLDYATFEGIIPEGYGAGTVIVWDTGTYDNISRKDGNPISMDQAYNKGHITFVLHGHKLKGAYSLIHTHMSGSEKNWLLIKTDDEWADGRRKPTVSQPKSVLSDMTIKALDKEFNAMKRSRSEE